MESSAIAGDRIENMVAEEQVEVVVNSGDDDGEAWGPLYKCWGFIYLPFIVERLSNYRLPKRL